MINNNCIENLIDDLDSGKNDLNSDEKPKEKHPTGQVVGIIRKKWRQYCGILQQCLVENVSKFYLLYLLAIINSSYV